MNPPAHPGDGPQLDLLGAIAPAPARLHRLFFAPLPDVATREALRQAAQELQARHPALRGRWVNPARYHATVHFLGDHAALREDVVAAAGKAAGALRTSTFEWTLDIAASFHGRQPPWVLRCAAVPGPLQQLWDELRHLLILLGQGRHIERNFTPHVTVAYSRGELLASTPIAPVRWAVGELALVHSVVGHADYEVLARWPLPARRG
ncbi:MAG: 2'-5' RNA ligase family protein [Xanthomonadaceae bacterium]|nr:2'-5' RNA ligase family protein [Xanthomonadaceae bacterium]